MYMKIIQILKIWLLDEPYTEEEVDKLELLNRISGFIDDMRGEIRARKETKFF